MAWDPLLTSEVDLDSCFTEIQATKVRDCLNYLYGTIGSLAGANGVPNGSFEVDSDSDGVPDSFTVGLYPGGSQSLETTSPAGGAQAIKFVHPGGASNGGGYADSDYIPVSEYMTYGMSFIHWASAAGMKNKVQARYFTKAKIELGSGSPADLYNSTSNPTTATYMTAQFTPPATTRYIKIRVIGGYTDTNVAGSAYFDDLILYPVIPENGVKAAAVSQTKLKTSAGSVSISDTSVPGDMSLAASGHRTLPGGDYGNYPTFKQTISGPVTSQMMEEAQFVYGEDIGTSYLARIYLSQSGSASDNGGTLTTYANQLYISASGRDHWIYLLRDKSTQKIIGGYQAPDHPSANTQSSHEEISHPFDVYDPLKHEIIIIDDDVLMDIKPFLNRRTGILDIIHHRCIVDDAKSAEYQAREIRKINEWPDDPYPGTLKVQAMKTPQWAKILIKSEDITLETFAIEKLPEVIQYRKLWLDKK